MSNCDVSPLVSVTMPVYNGARYLSETINSIRAQTLTDWELIVVDDASSDQSREILETYAGMDSRILVFRHEYNKGHRAASNFAFSLARGRYVARTDQDDISLPRRLEIQARYLDANPAVGLVASGHYRLFPDGRKLAIRKGADPVSVRWGLLFDNVYCHSTFMFRSQFVTGPNPYRHAPSAYDYEICARLAWQTQIRAIAEPLVCYRIHSAGLATTDRSNMLTAALAISSRELRRVLGPGELDRAAYCALRRLATGQHVTSAELKYLPKFRKLLRSFQEEVGATDSEMKRIWRLTLRRLVAHLPLEASVRLWMEDPVGVGDSLLTKLHRGLIRPARKRLVSTIRNPRR